jgi:hypothetical protein
MSAAVIHLFCSLCDSSASLRETKTSQVSRRGAEEAETAEGAVL